MTVDIAAAGLRVAPAVMLEFLTPVLFEDGLPDQEPDHRWVKFVGADLGERVVIPEIRSHRAFDVVRQRPVDFFFEWFQQFLDFFPGEVRPRARTVVGHVGATNVGGVKHV